MVWAAFNRLQQDARQRMQQLVPGYEQMDRAHLRTHLAGVLTTKAFVDVTETATFDSMMGDGRYFLTEAYTGSCTVTEVAREVYYGSNFFRFEGVGTFQGFIQEHESETAGGLQARELLQRVSFSVRTRDEGDEVRELLQGLDLPQVRMVVIYLKAVSDKMLNRLRIWISGPAMQPMIDQMAEQLAEGVLVTESLPGMGGSWVCTYAGLSGQGWTRQSAGRLNQMVAIWDGYNRGLHHVLLELGEGFFEDV
ncbi:hypothetical protein BDV12DRAFT_201594 [Aspergillus spectabilis]